MKQRKRVSRRLLATGLAAVMLFAAACGSTKDEKTDKQADTQSKLVGDTTGVYYAEKNIDVPFPLYNNEKLVQRPDGAIEILVQTNSDQLVTAAAPAATDDATDASLSPTKDVAEAEIPMPSWKLYTLNQQTNGWDVSEPEWIHQLEGMSRINSIGFDGEGNRYILYTKEDKAPQDMYGYTPEMPYIARIDANGNKTDVEMEWYTYNWETQKAIPATFEKMPEMPAAMKARMELEAIALPEGGSATVEAEKAANDATIADTDKDETEETAAESTEPPAVDATESKRVVSADPAIVEEELAYQMAANKARETWPSTYEMVVSSNGDLLLNQGGLWMRYSGQDGKYIEQFEAYSMSPSMRGNHLLGLRAENDLAYYDFSSEKMVTLPSFSNENQSYQSSFTEQDGLIYAVSAGGIFTWKSGDAEWTQIAGQELLALSMPDMNIQSILPDDKGGLYILTNIYMEAGSKCIHIVPTDEAPTQYSTTLRIFAMSEQSAYSLRRLAYDYRVQHPDVMISIEVGMNYDMMGSSSTEQEVLNAFNVELLAGKGPDIIVLDGMPIDSYIEKGVLADLSEWANEKMKSEGWMEGLARAYESGGKIYALPTSMTVPILMGKKEALDQIHSLHDLADYVSKDTSGKPAVFDTSHRGVLSLIFFVYNDIFTSEGKVNSDAMKQFLEDIKTISETDKGKPLSAERNKWYEEAIKENPEMADDYRSAMYINNDSVGYAYGDMLFNVTELYSLWEYRSAQAVLAKAGDSAMALVSSGEQKLFTPNTILGINAKTDEMEHCLQLLEIITAGEQGGGMTRSFGIPLKQENLFPKPELGPDGKPVEELDIVSVDASWGSFSDESGRTLEIRGRDTKEHAQQMLDFLQPLNTPVTIDPVLINAVGKGSAPYFRGECSADEAVQKIEAELKIYLSEREK